MGLLSERLNAYLETLPPEISQAPKRTPDIIGVAVFASNPTDYTNFVHEYVSQMGGNTGYRKHELKNAEEFTFPDGKKLIFMRFSPAIAAEYCATMLKDEEFKLDDVQIYFHNFRDLKMTFNPEMTEDWKKKLNL